MGFLLAESKHFELEIDIILHLNLSQTRNAHGHGAVSGKAVSHVEEPYAPNVEDSQKYFGFWAAGKNFGVCAWSAQRTWFFQAVGDPFVAQ